MWLTYLFIIDSKLHTIDGIALISVPHSLHHPFDSNFHNQQTKITCNSSHLMFSWAFIYFLFIQIAPSCTHRQNNYVNLFTIMNVLCVHMCYGSFCCLCVIWTHSNNEMVAYNNYDSRLRHRTTSMAFSKREYGITDMCTWPCKWGWWWVSKLNAN